MARLVGSGWLAGLRKGGFEMKRFDLARIMRRAWEIFRKAGDLPFGEALHRSWAAEKARPVNEARIAAAKAAAGVDEDCKSWSDWKKAGYEVIHGSKALFGCDLIWASKGDGKTYKARFFGRSQVAPLAAAA